MNIRSKLISSIQLQTNRIRLPLQRQAFLCILIVALQHSGHYHTVNCYFLFSVVSHCALFKGTTQSIERTLSSSIDPSFKLCFDFNLLIALSPLLPRSPLPVCIAFLTGCIIWTWGGIKKNPRWWNASMFKQSGTPAFSLISLFLIFGSDEELFPPRRGATRYWCIVWHDLSDARPGRNPSQRNSGERENKKLSDFNLVIAVTCPRFFSFLPPSLWPVPFLLGSSSSLLSLSSARQRVR